MKFKCDSTFFLHAAVAALPLEIQMYSLFSLSLALGFLRKSTYTHASIKAHTHTQMALPARTIYLFRGGIIVLIYESRSDNS